MLKIDDTYTLNAENIDKISEKADQVCQSLDMPSDQKIRIRLFIEEVLIEWLEKSEKDVKIEFKSGYQFFKPYINLSFESSESLNPLKTSDFGVYYKAVFEQLTFAPDYSYKRGRNNINIRLKRPEKNPIFKLFMVIVVSLIVGFLGQLLLPESTTATLQQYLIGPTYGKFLEVLGCIAGPLIFFSVAWGIYGIGDTTTLNKLGKGLVFRYLRNVFIAALACVVFFPAFGGVISSGRVDFTQILSVYTMFLNMLPTTVIEPFATGNTIQIIVLAVVVGIALLYLGSKTRYVAVAIEQINLITSFLMEIISKLVPLFIALVLINMLWSGTLNTLTSAWRFVLILILAVALTALVFLVLSSIQNKVKISILIKKTLPSYLIALTTASSAASFGTLVKDCEHKFGISDSLTSFGVPLGIVMHKVASAVNAILIAFYIAGMYRIECSLSWIVMAVLISAITAIATPPIPGGAVIGYTMLFTQLGLPEEGLAIALTIDVLTDFLITSTNIFCLPMALTGVARKYDLLDREVLQKEI